MSKIPKSTKASSARRRYPSPNAHDIEIYTSSVYAKKKRPSGTDAPADIHVDKEGRSMPTVKNRELEINVNGLDADNTLSTEGLLEDTSPDRALLPADDSQKKNGGYTRNGRSSDPKLEEAQKSSPAENQKQKNNQQDLSNQSIECCCKSDDEFSDNFGSKESYGKALTCIHSEEIPISATTNTCTCDEEHSQNKEWEESSQKNYEICEDKPHDPLRSGEKIALQKSDRSFEEVLESLVLDSPKVPLDGKEEQKDSLSDSVAQKTNDDKVEDFSLSMLEKVDSGKRANTDNAGPMDSPSSPPKPSLQRCPTENTYKSIADDRSTSAKPELVLYYDIMKPQARSCLMLICLLKINVELRYIDFSRSEQQTDDYLKLSAARSLPILVHNDLVLTNSHTILMHLCDISPGPESQRLLPADYLLRMKIMNMLFFEAEVLQRRHSNFMTDIACKNLANIDYPQHEKKVLDGYATVNKFLKDSSFLVGDTLTIADISMVATVSALDLIFPLDWYKYLWPQLFDWFRRIRGMPMYRLNFSGKERSSPCVSSKASKE